MSLNRFLIAAGSVLVMVLVLAYVLFASKEVKYGSPRDFEATKYYFYDLAEKTLIDAPKETVPPFTTATGGTAAQAYVFACKHCDSDSFVAYLAMYTPKAKVEVEKLIAQATDKESRDVLEARIYRIQHDGGYLIGDPQGQNWYPLSDPKAQELTRSIHGHCGPKQPYPYPCYPG